MLERLIARALTRLVRRIAAGVALVAIAALLVPALVLADTPVHVTQQAPLPYPLLWSAIVGFLTPAVGYIVNSALWRHAPEFVKWLVSTVITATAAAITTAVTSSTFGFNDGTYEAIGLAILTAIAGHTTFMRNGVQARLVKPPRKR